jgi:choice-of-anchor B domain-containing protein
MKYLAVLFFPLVFVVGLNAQISVNNSQIKDLSDPVDSQDAVSKSYLLSQMNQLQTQIKYLQRNLNVTPANECIDGNAGGYACMGINLMSSVNLQQLNATMANDCWGWTDTKTGSEYAIIGLDNGTAFIDVTIPNQPVVLGKLPTQTEDSSWRDVKVFENYAYIVSEAENHGMQVFDLTHLRDTENFTIFSSDGHYDGFGNAHNIAINEHSAHAYVVGSQSYAGGAHFIDITNPENPTNTGGYAESGYSHDAMVVNYNGPDLDYKGKEIYFGSNEDEVVIVDVTDKSNPTFISSFKYSQTQYTHQGWLTADHKYFFVGDELDELYNGINTRTIILDLTDLDQPQIHFEYMSPLSVIDHNGYVVGDLFYLASYTGGLRILDLKNIESKEVTEKYYFDTFIEPETQVVGSTFIKGFDEDHDNPRKGNEPLFDGAWSVYPFFKSGTIIVSDISGGLFVLKIREL